jgi:tellurite methyltransferase
MKTTVYDNRYGRVAEYWKPKPSAMAYKALEILLGNKENIRVLDVGCGEGTNALFFARNGCQVSAFDLASSGVSKTIEKAKALNLSINVFRADINTYNISETYDLVFSSGTMQYLKPENRKGFMDMIKSVTNLNGLNVIHTFVSKPFIPKAPDAEEDEHLWSSGELLGYYHDWETHNFIEEIKECNSSGIKHVHAHNRIWTVKR